MTKAQVKPNSVEATIDSLEKVRSEIETLKTMEEELKQSLVAAFLSDINSFYKQKEDGPFGTVRIPINGLDLIFNTPKKVEWEQEGLAELHKEGAPVKVEYSVSETTFKDLDQAGRDAFMPFRTVSPGKITVKIERK